MAEKEGTTTSATAALADENVPYAIHHYEQDENTESYGREAAESMGVDPRRVFKTLVAKADGSPVIAVVPVSALLDLRALAAAVGASSATIADPTKAEKITGYKIGGISPIGQRKPRTTIVDSSALDFPTIYVSAGKRGCDLELAPDDLIRLTRARTAPVSRRR